MSTINDIGFSAQSINALAKYGVRTLEDLLQLDQREFEAMHGIGEHAVKAVKAYFTQHGLSFSRKPSNIPLPRPPVRSDHIQFRLDYFAAEAMKTMLQPGTDPQMFHAVAKRAKIMAHTMVDVMDAP